MFHFPITKRTIHFTPSLSHREKPSISGFFIPLLLKHFITNGDLLFLFVNDLYTVYHRKHNAYDGWKQSTIFRHETIEEKHHRYDGKNHRNDEPYFSFLIWRDLFHDFTSKHIFSRDISLGSARGLVAVRFVRRCSAVHPRP
jgi:hypothetical protein